MHFLTRLNGLRKRARLDSDFFVSACVTLTLLGSGVAAVGAETAEPVSSLARLPVREITVFKDGHALVLHEGKMPTDSSGNVVMDYLPTPVLGTMWPFCQDKSAKLTAVVAGRHKVLVPRTALTLPQLLEGNTGAEVHLTERKDSGTSQITTTYDGTILGVPTRSSQELEETSPPNSGEKLAEKSSLVMLKTAAGTTVLPSDHLQDIFFKQSYSKKLSMEEFRNVLVLKLDWQHHQPAETASVGMMYLQGGMRWIPSYKVNLDNSGNASVKLQATLVNDLTDLDDVTANLVIGVPTVVMKGETDPIALQQTVASVSAAMHSGRMASVLSNAISSQVVAQNYQDAETTVGGGESPQVTNSEQNEDLYVFTVKHVCLKKGQRMVVPVAEFTLPFKDIYTLDVPFSPPKELQAYSSNRTSESTALRQAPHIQHKIRLKNSSQYPLTTAPALIFHGDRILAQSLMTYAAAGAAEDLDITTAVDIKVKKTDRETARVANALKWQGSDYARIDLAGTLSLTNFTHKPVELEIKRQVLGKVTKTDHNGTAAMLNVAEEMNQLDHPFWWGWYNWPDWWGWYNWPDWWHHVNGVGSITWKLNLPPSESVDLGYNWQYYWR